MVTLTEEELKDAKRYGYSFNSKQVAQGPHFFNLRTMCECFGRALAKHVDFSETDGTARWLLDEDDKQFSYAFKDDLKITTDLQKAKEMHPPEEEVEVKEMEATFAEYTQDDFEPEMPEIEEREFDIELSTKEVALVATIRQD